MYNVVETFSGIGSQVQALKNIGVKHKIVGTVEWDINAICAYDVLHHNDFEIEKYNHLSKKDLINILSKYSLSSDGKNPVTRRGLLHLSSEALKRIYLSIQRNKNFVNIKDLVGSDLSEDIDILTYSFPCQDLSICGFWHGNTSGIDREALNRSGLLWEIERILHEMTQNKIKLPRVLLMENVSNILSDTHKKNFNEWKLYLESVGYYNYVYKLNALNFGIPQNRTRVFMISIQCPTNKTYLLEEYFKHNNLENRDIMTLTIKNNTLLNFLRVDYNIVKYYQEAIQSQPNFTKSRKTILKESKILYDGKELLQENITTITTKQDRNPNSGLIILPEYFQDNRKACYRNLTGRECMLLMGFEEIQFDKLLEHNFKVNKSRNFFINSKFIKMAGNSIVVQVLEEIFKQIIEIDELLK